MTLLLFVLVLSFLIIIHELGHFIMAKRAKIKVFEFGLGYPPRAIKLFTWQGTDFTLNWIPFGGFVKMEGEEGEAEGETKRPTAFSEKSTLERLSVILAGVTVNFLFGVIAFATVFSFMGIPYLVDQPRIGSVNPDSPAAAAGVPTQVNILGFKIGDETITTTSSTEVRDVVESNQGQSVTVLTTGSCTELSCEERLQEFPLTIRNRGETPANQGLLGVTFAPVVEYQFYPPYEMPFRGMWYGIQQALGLGLLIIQSLGDLITGLFTRGTVPAELSGPVGIYDQTEKSGVFNQGFLAILNYTGILSINLAIMNLLPIPALDGGRALFILIEKIVGKGKVARVEQIVNASGMAMLLGLILLITARDVWRIFQS
ncbi:MAG: site-2 protease family protein [bacterium]|nr:site-2 protease family protein [bacterium]